MTTLGDLTYFNNRSMGGVGEDEVNSARGQEMLANLQKYDPTAAFVQSYGSDGQSLGYTLNFDPRRLPGVAGQSQLGQGAAGVGTGNTFMPRFSTVQPHMNLANPNAVVSDPNYGRITDNGNIYDKPDFITKYGPAIIAALGMGAPALFGAAGLGMGAGASAAIGAQAGGLGASAGGVAGLTGVPSQLVMSLVKGFPGMANNAIRGTFNPLSLIPYAGSAVGLPPVVGMGAATLGSLARGRGG